MEYLTILTIVFLGFLCDSKVICDEFDGDDEFFNKFLEVLTCDCVGDLVVPSETDDVTEPQPIFANGIWECGACNALDETKVVYSESNRLDITNTNADPPMSYLIDLVLPESRCITFSGEHLSTVEVARTSGACNNSLGSDVLVGFKILPRRTQELDFRVTVYAH